MPRARRRAISTRERRPDPSFWLHADGIEELWDGDFLVAGGWPVAAAMWAEDRTQTWRLWLRDPSFVPPAAAATFDGLLYGSKARESVEQFRDANPGAARAVAAELEAFVNLAERDADDLRARRAATYGPRVEDHGPLAEPEGSPSDDDDADDPMWLPVPYDPEPAEMPAAPVVELRPMPNSRETPRKKTAMATPIRPTDDNPEEARQ